MSIEFPYFEADGRGDPAADGIAIDSLDAGTSLTVRTLRSKYRLTVLDGPRGDVIVQGGLRFPERRHACLVGSTGGGTAVKIGWLGLGRRMELAIGQRMISTSLVRSITIEGISPPPGAFPASGD